MQRKPISPELLAQILSPEVQKRFWGKVEIKSPDECWPWLASQTKGRYGAFGIWREGKTIPARAHKIAWISHNKIDVPDGLHVLHSCIGHPECCNPSHLRPGTPKENTADMFNQGRQNKIKARGEANGFSILTEDIVRKIRNLYDSGNYNCSEISSLVGFKRGTVYAVATRIGWKHIV